MFVVYFCNKNCELFPFFSARFQSANHCKKNKFKNKRLRGNPISWWSSVRTKTFFFSQACVVINSLVHWKKLVCNWFLWELILKLLCFHFYNFKGTVRSDEMDLRVVPLDSPSLGHQLLWILNLFNLGLNFWSVFKVLIHLIQKYLQFSYFFDRRVV